MELTINNDFYNLIPPLSLEELSSLEASLKQEGCRDPLVVWNNTIIDGHHRYAICSKYGISFNVIEKSELKTELDVKLWMINNQFSRRNLTNIQKAELAIEMEKIEQVQAKERQLANLKQFSKKEETAETSYSTDRPDLAYREESGKSLEIAAKKAGIGYETVRKTKHILEKAPEELVEKVRKGDISIDRAFTQIQKAERLEKNKDTEWPKR
jgi:hypothetical protein